MGAILKTNASRRGTTKTRVLEHEIEAARKFLKADPIGRRLQAGEHALTLLIKGELPRIKRFVFNATYDLRRVLNPKDFEQSVNSNPKFADLIKKSKSGAYIRPHFDKDYIQFTLFYGKDLTSNEAALFADTFTKIISATYASLGLDMNGFAGTLDEDSIKSSISEGV